MKRSSRFFLIFVGLTLPGINRMFSELVIQRRRYPWDYMDTRGCITDAISVSVRDHDHCSQVSRCCKMGGQDAGHAKEREGVSPREPSSGDALTFCLLCSCLSGDWGTLARSSSSRPEGKRLTPQVGPGVGKQVSFSPLASFATPGTPKSMDILL